VRGNRAVSSVG